MYDQQPTYYQPNLEETEVDMLMDLLSNSPAGLVAKEDFDPYKDYTDSDDYSWVEEEEI